MWYKFSPASFSREITLKIGKLIINRKIINSEKA